ncbi:NYN domain-containing protein [Nocardioides sp. NPDC006273]|uniref:NYN domain-containing protein n=1 Tax=Nocardioides sp. NPDC006273 TaxID=3155598 RepID=UPI0033B2AC5B
MEVSAYATLPDTVRGRIVALTAGVLPDVARLPPALKRIADFAPARRAKAGGAMIASVLDGDDEVREKIGSQLRPAYVTEGSPDDLVLPEEPTEAAAVLWLVRPDGWEVSLKEALDRLEAAAVPAVDAEVARLRVKLAAAEDEIREVRADRKVRIDDLKADNTALRRKLGEARAAAREAGTGLDEALTEARAALSRAEDELSARDRQLRQLRSQIDKLEREAAAERRTSKTDREDASLRARFLLDTLLDAAGGLRRELALPPVTGTPGERVESELASADPVAGAGVTSSAHLEQFLAMPRVRLIVDGYNVSKALWPGSALDAQRLRLLRAIAPIAARTGAETTVVFDAHSASVRPTAVPPRGVKVLFSPEGVIADDVIRDLVDAEPSGRIVLVATDDAEVVKDVRRAGARTVPLASLSPLLG